MDSALFIVIGLGTNGSSSYPKTEISFVLLIVIVIMILPNRCTTSLH